MIQTLNFHGIDRQQQKCHSITLVAGYIWIPKIPEFHRSCERSVARWESVDLSDDTEYGECQQTNVINDLY